MKYSWSVHRSKVSVYITLVSACFNSSCVVLSSPTGRQAIIPRVYVQQWYQTKQKKLVKPKKGHSNNTQGQWWEPVSLPVIFHLFTELMTVAGRRELGASRHVMSLTHARGLEGQAGDKDCGLWREKNLYPLGQVYSIWSHADFKLALNCWTLYCWTSCDTLIWIVKRSKVRLLA